MTTDRPKDEALATEENAPALLVTCGYPECGYQFWAPKRAAERGLVGFAPICPKCKRVLGLIKP